MKTYSIHLYIGAFILLGLLIHVPAASQVTNTSYFMKTYSGRTTLNPALRPEQGYLGMPFVLNNLYVDARTNSLNMDHLTFPKNGDLLSFMHRDVSSREFLSGISKNNYLDIDLNYTLFSMGFFKGEGFWNIDLKVRSYADASLPYSLFEMVKKGFGMNEPAYYNIKETRVTANAYAELGVGYSRTFLDKTLTVGTKGKFLAGLASADFHLRDMKIDAGLDEWSVRSYAALEVSAPGIYPEFDEDGYMDSFGWGEKFAVSGFGFGWDIGVTYDLIGISHLVSGIWEDIFDRTTFSLAFTDLGLIKWSKNNTSTLYSSMEDEIIAGNFQIDFNDNSSLEEDLDDIIDKFEEIIKFKERSPKGHTSGLRTRMNISLEYEILPAQLSAGLLSTSAFNSSHTMTETTLAVNYRPCKWFESAVSYSFIHSKFNTFGLALHLNPTRGVQFFLSSDYIIPHVNSEFIPVTSKAINLQVGLAIPLGKRVTS